MFPRYKILCATGIAQQTRVVDLKTGLDLEGVTEIYLAGVVDSFWEAKITLIGVALEMQSEGHISISQPKAVIDFRAQAHTF